MENKDVDKELNHSVKTKDQWAYTTAGKIIRGLLYMLTYIIFISFLGLIGYVFTEFGTQIISDKEYDLGGSFLLKERVSDEAELIANCVEDIENYKKNSVFKVIDVDKNMINTYSLSDMVNAEIYNIDNLSDIKQFIVDSSPLEGSMYDEEYGFNVINNGVEDSDDCYLFFTGDSFKRIFIENGLKNTNRWLSDEFPDSAYIIYLDPDVMQVLKDYEWELEDYAVLVEENSEANWLSDQKCAVYDPVQNIFYSSWDDYFVSYTHYIYKLSEIKKELNSHYNIGEEVSSIIFPLLWSVNHRDIWELVSDGYIGVNNPEYELERRNGSAFLYYIETTGDEKSIYSNVSDVQDIQKAGNIKSYVISGDDYDGTINTAADSAAELYGHDDILTALNGMGSNSVMYFGIDTSKLTEDDESVAASYVWAYENIAVNIRFIVALAAVSFILLMLQAAFLIRTTGRKNREDTEVLLNRFDKSYLEIWLMISVGVIALSVILIYLVVESAANGINISKSGYRTSAWNLYIVANGIVSSIVFGFSLMQLTLSFARRLKAGNFGHKILVREIYKWIGKKSSDERLKIYIGIYIGVEGLFLLYIYYNQIWRNVILPVFFVVMWIIAIYAVGRLSSDLKQLRDGVDRISKGDFDTEVQLQHSSSVFNELAIGINHISDGLKTAVDKSLKDERMKTELITNVSHDLKTPLTSIINYINLLKREKMPTPEAEHYVEVLDSKAHRLSQLTEDLVEAAKATSGNIELNMMPLSFDELLKQALGEFEDKFDEKKLTPLVSYPNNNDSRSYMVMADGRRLFRILDNVLQNAYKYALENTRVYIEIMSEDDQVRFVMKNISKAPLNISADELMERFTRGDSSRTTEGSGLGLSIAKDLTRLMGGSFEIELDGDLFKVIILFPQLQSL